MSTPREAARDRIHDAIRRFFDGTDSYPFTSADVTEAVLDAVMPQITEQKQLLGVPDGSILLDRFGHLYMVERGYVVTVRTRSRVDKDFVDNNGMITVIAMP